MNFSDLYGRHIICTQDWAKHELDLVLDLAGRMKRDRTPLNIQAFWNIKRSPVTGCCPFPFFRTNIVTIRNKSVQLEIYNMHVLIKRLKLKYFK